MSRLKPLIVVLVLLGMLGGCVMLIRGCFTGEVTVVRIGYMRNLRSLPLFMALEKDLFTKAGLTVKCEPFESPAQGLKDLNEDRTDVCISLPILSLIRAEAEKTGTTKILYLAMITAEAANDAILVRKTSAMKTPAELRGRRVGIPPGKTNRAFALLALRTYLGDKPDVKLVEIPQHQQLAALKNRNVMALLAFEPTITKGEEQGVSKILVNGPLVKALMDPMPIAGTAIAMSFVEENPKTTRKIVGVLNKATGEIRKDEALTRNIAAKELKLTESVAASLPIDQFWTLADLDPQKRSALQTFADILHRENVLDKPFRMEQLYLEKGMIPKRGTQQKDPAESAMHTDGEE